MTTRLQLRRRVIVVVAALVVVALAGWLWHRSSSATTPTIESHASASPVAATDTAATAASSSERAARATGGTDEAARAASPSVVLHGLVRGAAGEPVAGASISWTPLPEGELDIPANWSAIDWSWVERTTQSTESDAHGEFSFSNAPPESNALGSVLWLTHANHAAAPILLAADRTAWPALVECTLEPRAPLSITVVDASAQPVEGAWVEQLGTQAPARALGDDRLVLAQRIFRRAWTTPASGELRTAALDGEQVLRAGLGALLAHPRRLVDPAGATVELALAETFAAQGQVTFQSRAPTDTPMYVGYWRFDGAKYEPVVESRVRPDLSWGPLELPVSGAASCAFRVHGGGAVPQTRLRSEPTAGEQVRIDFEVFAGETLSVRVTDSQSKAPIAGAKVEVTSRIDATDRRRSEACTDADGRARVDGCTSGTVTVQASARGYLTHSAWETDYPPGFAETIELALERAGRLRGTVVHAGQPVRDFGVHFWPTDPQKVRTKVFSGRADGSFELDEVPLGDLSVTASTTELANCEPEPVHVAADAIAEVRLELPDAVAGRGRVVDAATGEPVTEASVQSSSSIGHFVLSRRGIALRVDREGGFRLDGLRVGDNWICVDAPGYASCLRAAWVDSLGEVDLGTIPLSRRQRLSVRLRGPDGTDYSAWQLAVAGSENMPYATFDANGLAEYAGLAPGVWEICARRADATDMLCVSVELAVGRPWEIELDLRGDVTLDVEVHAEDDGRWRDPGLVLAHFTGPDGERFKRWGNLSDNGTVTLRGLDARYVTVDVLDGTYEATCSSSTALTPGPNHLRIDAGAQSVQIQVVDAQHQPIESALISLHASLSGVAWVTARFTDREGLARFPELAGGQVTAVITHESHGSLHSVPVELRARRDPIVIELAPRARLRTRFVDGPLPLARVGVRVQDDSNVLTSPIRPTDAAGNLDVGPMNECDLQVEVVEPGYWRAPTAVRSTIDGPVATVQARRLGSLTLQVRNATSGLPVAGAHVALRSLEFDTDVASWISQQRVPAPSSGMLSDAQGRLTIQGLPRGEYRWSIGTSAEGLAVVPPHAVATLDVLVP